MNGPNITQNTLISIEHRITQLETQVSMLEKSIQALRTLVIANFSATVSLILALIAVVVRGG